MQDRTKREKNRPDIVEEEGKIDGPRGVGNRESGSIVPADDGPFFVVVEQPKKKEISKWEERLFFIIGSFIGSAQLFSQTEMGAHDDG